MNNGTAFKQTALEKKNTITFMSSTNTFMYNQMICLTNTTIYSFIHSLVPACATPIPMREKK